MQDLVEQAIERGDRSEARPDEPSDAAFGDPTVLLVGVGAGGIERLRWYDSCDVDRTAVQARATTVRSLVVPTDARSADTDWADTTISLTTGVEPTARRPAWLAGKQRARQTANIHHRDAAFAAADYCLLTVDADDAMALGAATAIARTASNADAMPLSIPVVSSGGLEQPPGMSSLRARSATTIPVDPPRARDHVAARQDDPRQCADERVLDLISGFVRLLTDTHQSPHDVVTWARQFSEGRVAVPWTGRLSTVDDIGSDLQPAIDPLFESHCGSTLTWSGLLLLGDHCTLTQLHRIENQLDELMEPNTRVATDPEFEWTHTIASGIETELPSTAVHLIILQFLDKRQPP